ncbi:tRNA pseudouridine synthase B [Magnetococcus marinus MC-1]|uniref:tRNA pseudouridine synthase B n=1 Tax=Magnetococcus marinus (strain ATCC BAA-1437 / JCM 17883 / MC-1) TaxID=156889 RepID=A0LE16_MAGMM|nr:tRNA pseudouridine(55) synthase TruB [Magnetococcus marinus]ABK46209.1 tRNA pseudouridine synthase B [Magnetococcus marinus MC-1]
MGRRRRKGVVIHGWLAIHKEPGLSSSQVVERVIRTTKANKAGHGGTLDPFSEGVLPIALGEATKTSGMVLNGDKSYRCWLKFGQETDSGDLTGVLLEEQGRVPSEAELRAVLPQFMGEIEQVPPVFSALRVDGERAYKRARRGEEVQLASRRVRIDRLELVGFEADTAVLDVACGKGTYIRSLGVDIARALHSRAHLVRLLRTGTMGFGLNDAVTLEQLREACSEGRLQEILYPVDRVLDDIPALRMTGNAWYRLRQGQEVEVEDAATPAGMVRLQDPDGQFGLLGEISAQADLQGLRRIKPTRLFHLDETPGSDPTAQ